MTAQRTPGICLLALLVPCITLLSPAAKSSEGAVSVYQPGFFDMMAGFMPEPGTYGETKLLFYDGKVDDTFLGNTIATRVTNDMSVAMFSVTHVTDITLFGGQYGFSALLPIADVDISASITDGNQLLRDTDTETGLGDLAITPVMLGWHSDKLHVMTLLDLYIPIGSYNADDLATTGLNRYAIEPMLNITFFDPESGLEASAAMGYVFNFENSDTDYESGDEFHLDFSVSRWLENGFSVGLAGYWFKQVTGDSGDGAILGSNKGEVWGLGPIVAYSFQVSKETELQLKAKYYTEFDATNRLEGDAFWLGASFNF